MNNADYSSLNKNLQSSDKLVARHGRAGEKISQKPAGEIIND